MRQKRLNNGTCVMKNGTKNLAFFKKVLFLLFTLLFLWLASSPKIYARNNATFREEKNSAYYQSKIDSINKILHRRKLAKDEKLKAKLYSELVNLHAKTGNLEKALHFYKKALLLFKKRKDRAKQIELHRAIALAYFSKEYYHVSIEFLKKELDLYEELNDTLNFAATTTEIGVLYMKNDTYEKAIDFFLRAFEIYKRINNPKGQAKIQNNIGNIYRKQEKYDIALTNLQEAYEMQKKVGDRFLLSSIQKNDKKEIADMLCELGQVYTHTAQCKKAKEVLDSSYSISVENRFEKIEMKCYKHYSQLYEKQNQGFLAVDNFIKYTNLKDTIHKKELNRKVEEYKKILEIEEKEKEVKEKEIELAQLELDKQINFRNSLFILSFLFAGLLVLVYFFLFMKKRKNKLLNAKNIELENANKNLRLELNEAEEADKTKASFLTEMSHKIRNPINEILEASNLLLKQKNDDNMRSEFVDKINKNSKDMQKVINTIIEIAKIEAGKIHVEKQGNYRDKTILIVDSDTINFLFIKALLIEHLGAKILGADNGKQALELCRQNRDIDLILIDIELTVLDRYEASSEIRKLNKEIPIIAQTTQVSDKEKILDAGYNDFISNLLLTAMRC